MQKDMFRKGLVCIIVVLFIGMSVTASIGEGIGISSVTNNKDNIKNIIASESDASRTSIYEKTTYDSVLTSLDDLCYPVLNGTLGENGWYTSNVTVSFVNDSEEIVAVYYILDGEDSAKYTGPFEVCEDKEHYLCWYYIDYEGDYSDVECINFKIDQTVPEVEVMWNAFKEEGIWYVRFMVSCNDNTSGVERVEFGIRFTTQYTDYEFPYVWIIEWNPDIFPPEWFFSFTVFDKAGNSAFDTVNFSDIKSYSSNQNCQESSFIPNSLNVMEKQIQKSNLDDDTTPPVTTCIFNPSEPDGDNGWYVSSVEITLEATDDLSGVDYIKYLLDDKDWKIYTNPIKVKSDGHHRITYYAVDKAGNVEEPNEVLRFKLDETVPKIEKFIYEAYEEGGKWYVTFTVQCSDAMSGMDRVEFYVNDELMITDSEEPYEWTIEWPDDVYEALVWAFNKAGNSDYDNDPVPGNYQSSQQSTTSSSNQLLQQMVKNHKNNK
ncbi:MAG: OmpL47-type beta-barrel domain-containing protein [Petrotogales bacterium]